MYNLPSTSAMWYYTFVEYNKLKADMDDQYTTTYCDMPGSPCLSKNGSNVRSVSF